MWAAGRLLDDDDDDGDDDDDDDDDDDGLMLDVSWSSAVGSYSSCGSRVWTSVSVAYTLCTGISRVFLGHFSPNFVKID